MKNDKQAVEEMANDICGIECHGMKCKDCDMGCEYRMLAEALYNAGYRKIPTNDWLTRGISEEQLAKEKAEAVAEHEAQLKRNVESAICAAIEKDFLLAIKRLKNAKLNLIGDMRIYADGKLSAYESILSTLPHIIERYKESEGAE